MRRQCSEEEFLKEIAAHSLEIVKQDGVYRHLRARRPDTYCMGFDIITYPGYLCYSGDMGCFVFSRVNDMLTFFRAGAQEGPIEINPRYWSEKLQAIDPHGGFQEYSADLFRDYIKEKLAEFKAEIFGDDAEEDVKKFEAATDKWTELEAEIGYEVLSKADDGEYAAYAAMRDFDHEGHEYDAAKARVDA